MKRNRFIGKSTLALAGAALAPQAVLAADEVKVGMLRLPTALLTGIDQGYFSAENIDVKPVFFNTDAEIVPALSSGQVDVAGTAPTADLFNALTLGVNATIVADYWTSPKDLPTGDSAFIMVRKDLAPYGTFKPQDVKSLTLAVTGHGQMGELFATEYLQTQHLPTSNVNLVDMPLADMNAAFVNHAIDIASTIDPYATLLVQQGTAVKAAALSTLMPGYVRGVIMYGQRIGKADKPLGVRFLRALFKANTSLRAQLATPAGRTTVAAIYQKYIPLTDPTLYARIGLATGPDDPKVDVESKYALRWQMERYVSEGLVTQRPDLNKSIDHTFAAPLEPVPVRKK